ncbi:PTS lactose transporter subunit IIB [Jidongwangia harbinensis]|uniref:PTS lactose transporter subunit IIB n=1 Tax=Jidongwangia harbinensis TaxID=2878561 RepID=UPI001CD92B41|nr:PTS lactose transporter subunit IIB [Jidongwangia harbinensis]MCA2214409.1 PTS lactose transporter subunit IIB [Jidongwangia harbinensis]
MTGIDGRNVRKVVVACDAGMGSSVMLAGQLRRQLGSCPVVVEHHPVGAIPADADVVLCHTALTARARSRAPGSVVVGFRLFLGDPAVARVVTAVRTGGRVDDAGGS